MTSGVPDSLERLSHADLIGVVRDLIFEVGRLRAENEKVNFALTQLKAEHQAVKDELARRKVLQPRKLVLDRLMFRLQLRQREVDLLILRPQTPNLENQIANDANQVCVR